MAEKIIPENIPGTAGSGGNPGWSAEDSAACWDEYIRHCREAHLRGEPVAELFSAKSAEAGR